MLIALMIFAIYIPALAHRSPTSRPEDAFDQWNSSVEALVKKVWPSVVQIQVTSYGTREDAERGNTTVTVGRQRSVGSGFVIDGDGFIMTNAHVVNGAQRIQGPTGRDSFRLSEPRRFT